MQPLKANGQRWWVCCLSVSIMTTGVTSGHSAHGVQLMSIHSDSPLQGCERPRLTLRQDRAPCTNSGPVSTGQGATPSTCTVRSQGRVSSYCQTRLMSANLGPAGTLHDDCSASSVSLDTRQRNTGDVPALLGLRWCLQPPAPADRDMLV